MIRPTVITMGDPAGIGPELIVKAFRDAPQITHGCFVAGDVAVMRRAAAAVCGAGEVIVPVAVLRSPQEAWKVPPRCVAVLPVIQQHNEQALPQWGKLSAVAGRMAGDSVVWAARAALRGKVAAMVTAPLHKEALAAAGAPYVNFAGHTELLQAEAAQHLQVPVAELPVRMMLVNPQLRTVLVSIHVSLREAIERVTQANVFETLRITHAGVGAALGRVPRIAVAGLNPHAGEGGLFGGEEKSIIVPAIERARIAGINAEGPFPPDTVFMRARHTAHKPGEFDVVVAMYHDQGLIPVKYLGVDEGVNVTLGLPLVRTSPDHGTAFDLAGTGRARADSLVAALRMANSLAGSQRAAV